MHSLKKNKENSIRSIRKSLYNWYLGREEIVKFSKERIFEVYVHLLTILTFVPTV